ncbi:MAG: ferric reductase-like transmembrane domain-containing protein [Gemmatimonadota bacterium]|nr:ferric reductase-like transmembrane domain-containing protein [Gemmatimonadota bacterium]
MDPIDISGDVALVAITLLTLNILIGLLMSTKYNPVRRWPHRHINTLQLHNWTAYAALAASLAHPSILLLSSTVHFRVIDLVYPVGGPKQQIINTLGALALYVLVFTVVTSYFRFEIGRRIWKPLHYATYAMFILFAIHAVFTDPTLKDAPLDPLDAEKVYVELCIVVVAIAIGLRGRWASRQPAPRTHRPKAARGRA